MPATKSNGCINETLKLNHHDGTLVTQRKPSYLYRFQCLLASLVLIALCWEGINTTDVVVSAQTSSLSFVIPNNAWNRRPHSHDTEISTSIQQQRHDHHFQKLQWTFPIKLGRQSRFCDNEIRRRLQLSSASHLPEFPKARNVKEDSDEVEMEQEPRLTTTTATTTTIGSIKPQLSVLTIPIFPLRKTVKLPTDNITLNLYEPRYIQMVEESIFFTSTNMTTSGMSDDLSDHNCHHSIPLFGAIYTTNLPHIIVPVKAITQNDPSQESVNTNNTYIVPILEPDMIGALFIVTNHTTVITQQNGSNKIIRLNATAILRFRIIQIIHTGGYNDVATLEHGNSDCPNKPYVVAQVQLLLSDTDTIPTYKSYSDNNNDDDNSNIITGNRLPNRNVKYDNASAVVDTTTTVLPNYLSDIITQYGTTILSSYFDPTIPDMIPRLEMVWIQELLYFYNITLLSSSSQRDNSVPLYLEQKERLQMLCQMSGRIVNPYNNMGIGK